MVQLKTILFATLHNKTISIVILQYKTILISILQFKTILMAILDKVAIPPKYYIILHTIGSTPGRRQAQTTFFVNNLSYK